MKKTQQGKALIISTLAFAFIAIQGAFCAPTFNQAVADYNAGKYGQAASAFETLKAAYPNNALTRYYLALCRQALGHYDKAREEYQFVATTGDARLKALAQQGMQRMGGSGSSGANYTGAHPAAVAAANAAMAAMKNGQTNSSTNPNASPVKKIYKFTAPWCAPCQRFRPIFEAVKPQFNNIQFEEVDYDTNPDLRAKYDVS
ncbi:MAG: tetratricopeptide repeat protein, partial [Candidatus Melainabacteria bacterium]|nr:tetratricopeptide repeat protein [Candidatus Melainabacteria bacterium]